MTISFKDIRGGVNPKPVVIKSYDLNGSKVIITNEKNSYIAEVDGVSIDDGFDNPLDAEVSAKRAIELLQKNLKGNK
jgi:hypothetical protein